MRGVLLTVGSLVLTAAVIGNAYYQKKQFYPSVVYITKSNPSMAVIYVQAFVLVILMGKLMRKVFFGQLRAAELEHLIERSWYAVTETCLAFTVFRDDFSPKFVALFTLLLFLKCFHWLADDRVDYMERSPVISMAFHARVISLLSVLGLLDAYFVNMAYYSTLMKGASVQLVFGFEYAILWTTVFNIIIKYMLHAIDLQSGNPWENKAVYLLYTELIMGFIKVVLYMTFMLIMIRIHTFPLFAIRPMYLTLRAFKKALNDVIMSRRAIRNMNTLYPDATPEELASVDNVCIICRDEMISASKKLPCNHIFHTSCLRSWFQRQQTCPTCRLDVLQTPVQQQQPQQQQPQPAVAVGQPVPQQQTGVPQANMAQPPQPNAPFFYPAPFPPAFAFWPPLQQPLPVPPQPPSANSANSGPQNSPTSSRPAEPSSSQPTSTTAAAATSASASTPPSMPSPFFFPPFPFLPHVPPPKPPPNFSGLTESELREMEGQERRHVEARIQCLRNIQTLLDAAVLEMQQYSVVVATLTATSNDVSSSAPQSSTSSKNHDPLDTNTANDGATATTSGDNEKATNITDVYPENSESKAEFQMLDSACDEKEQLRRRRLQRFAEQPPPAGNGNALDLD